MYPNTFLSPQIIYRFFTSHLRHSKFLTSHSLMFNPPIATYKLPPLAATHSHVPLLYVIKSVKPKSAMIHLWLHKKSLTFHNIGPFLPNGLSPIYQKSSLFLHKTFRLLFKIQLANSLVKKTSLSDPYIVNKAGSRMPSLSTYLI